jgi:hypothetical protein
VNLVVFESQVLEQLLRECGENSGAANHEVDIFFDVRRVLQMLGDRPLENRPADVPLSPGPSVVRLGQDVPNLQPRVLPLQFLKLLLEQNVRRRSVEKQQSQVLTERNEISEGFISYYCSLPFPYPPL